MWARSMGSHVWVSPRDSLKPILPTNPSINTHPHINTTHTHSLFRTHTPPVQGPEHISFHFDILSCSRCSLHLRASSQESELGGVLSRTRGYADVGALRVGSAWKSTTRSFAEEMCDVSKRKHAHAQTVDPDSVWRGSSLRCPVQTVSNPSPLSSLRTPAAKTHHLQTHPPLTLPLKTLP